MKRINDLEIENEKLNEEINRLNAKLYTASKDQTEKIRKYYEDLLKKKDLDIGKQLRMYLENLRSIKKSIEDSKIDDILHENEIYTEEKMTIEKQLKMIKQ